MKERGVYQRVIQEGLGMGLLLYRIHDGMGQRHPADFGGIVVKECNDIGMAVLVEVKREGEELREHQEVWLDTYARSGGVAYVVYVQKGELRWERR